MIIEKIPDYILTDLHERGLSNTVIANETPEYLFKEYCNWQGLINWGDSLITVLDELRRAEK